MNNKEHHAFALFFVIFLAVSSFPVLLAILQNTRNGAIRGYDTWMKNRKIKVVQPKKKINSPYGEKLPKHPPVVQPKKKVYSDSKYSIIRKYDAFSKLMLPERKHVEQWAIKTFPFQDEFSTFNMAFKYHLGMVCPIEKEATIALPDSKYGTHLVKFYWNADRFSFSAGQMKLLNRYKRICEQNNAHLFVVFRPHEFGIHDRSWEAYKGLIVDKNEQLFQKAEQLRKNNYKVFELWDAMGQNIPREKHMDYWYRTDHHWNVYGALLGAKLIADYMNKNCGTSYDLKYFDPNTFICKSWKDVMIGSLGKKLSVSYSDGEKEDFDQLYPRYKTDFTIQIPELHYCRRGSFAIFFYNDRIRYDSLHSDCYSSFMDGSKGYVKIINHKIKEGKKVAVLKDSYSLAMAPYLALQTKELLLFDTRFISDKKIFEILREEKPNVLFVMCRSGF